MAREVQRLCPRRAGLSGCVCVLGRNSGQALAELLVWGMGLFSGWKEGRSCVPCAPFGWAPATLPQPGACPGGLAWPGTLP